jgi:hypothetical protein
VKWKKDLDEMEAEYLHAEEQASPFAAAKKVKFLESKLAYNQAKTNQLNAISKKVEPHVSKSLNYILQADADASLGAVAQTSPTLTPSAVQSLTKQIVSQQYADMLDAMTSIYGTSAINAGIGKYKADPYAQPVKPLVVDNLKDVGHPKIDEQKFIQKIGMLGNCNVNIQKRADWSGTAYSVVCEVCNKREEMPETTMTLYILTDPKLVSFLKTHRHDTVEAEAPSIESDGRRFRELTEDSEL